MLAASTIAGAALEQQLVPPHKFVDALWVHALGPLAIQQRSHAAVAVARSLTD